MVKELTLIRSSQVEIQFDRSRDWRARIGFVILASDGTIEGEISTLAPPGVGINFARLPGSNEVTAENLY